MNALDRLDVRDDRVADQRVDQDRRGFADERQAVRGEVEGARDVGRRAGHDAAAAEGVGDRAVDVAGDDALDLR